MKTHTHPHPIMSLLANECFDAEQRQNYNVFIGRSCLEKPGNYGYTDRVKINMHAMTLNNNDHATKHGFKLK